MIRKLDLPDSAALTQDSAKMEAPSATRNIAPILETLTPYMPRAGRGLELASGTGQHAVALAHAFPAITWQPTEADAVRLASIAEWRAEAAVPNLLPPVALDAVTPGWGRAHGPVDVLYLVNLLHLISYAEAAVLLDEAAQVLVPTGIFALYGPFLRDGHTTSPGDAAFHASLKTQDPSIGYKELGMIEDVMGVLGFRVEVHEMPANNVMAIVRR